MLNVLQPAPDFRAPAVLGKGDVKEVSLSDYRGHYLVLFFYPLDFTFVCPTEIVAFSERLGEFEALGAKVVGASCDSQFSHQAWLERGLGPLRYPLIADFSKELARLYGVLLPDGFPSRTTFIIDPAGVIQYASSCSPNVGRSLSETLRVLDALRTNEKTPVEWKRGEPTLG